MNKIMLFACTFLLGIITISGLEARPRNQPGYGEGYSEGSYENGQRPGERYVRTNDIRSMDPDGDGYYQEGDIDPNCAYQSGPCVCYCPVTRFKPQHYCTTRCEKEPYTVTKKCTRCVPEYYQKTCCRMVPQYYCVTKCRYKTECYDECKTCYRNKYCKDWHCRYVPYTCIEKRCIDCPAPTQSPCCPAPVCPVCPTCPR